MFKGSNRRLFFDLPADSFPGSVLYLLLSLRHAFSSSDPLVSCEAFCLTCFFALPWGSNSIKSKESELIYGLLLFTKKSSYTG